MSKSKAKAKELSDVQINNIFAGNPQYIPCVSKNQLTSAKDLGNRFVIVNMQDSNKGNGTHWVLLYNCLPNHIIYFDSMGEVPPQNILKIIKQSGKKLLKNPYELQTMGTVTCGYFCIVVVMMLHGGYSFQKILESFNLNDTSSNEKKVIQWVTPLLKMTPKQQSKKEKSLQEQEEPEPSE